MTKRKANIRKIKELTASRKQRQIPRTKRVARKAAKVALKKKSVLTRNVRQAKKEARGAVKKLRKVAKKPIARVRKALTGGNSVAARNLRKAGGEVFTASRKLWNRYKSKRK